MSEYQKYLTGKYPVESKHFLLRYVDREAADLPAIFRDIDFHPTRVTAKKKSVKVFGGLLKFETTSLIFEEY